MKISTGNFTAVPDKELCDCPIRLYESPLTGKRVSIHRGENRDDQQHVIGSKADADQIDDGKS